MEETLTKISFCIELAVGDHVLVKNVSKRGGTTGKPSYIFLAFPFQDVISEEEQHQ